MEKEAWGVVQSLISAASGLFGVWFGGYLTNQREEKRQSVERQQAATYLATLVLAHLDRFIEDCVAVAYDDGTSEGQPAGGDGYHQATTSVPTFDPLGMNVDWKAISADIMYEILNLPHRSNELQRHLSDPGFDDPPDYWDYFWARQHEYAKLGLEVVALASRLRSWAELPATRPGPHGRPRETLFKERVDHLVGVRRDVDERRAVFTWVTPPVQSAP